MKFWNRKELRRKLRSWHRDLGFLFTGICIIYAFSGILLNHMGGKDPAFKTEERTVNLKPGLSGTELMELWNSDNGLPPAKRVFTVDDEHLRIMLDGGVGIYSSNTGMIDYEKHTKRLFVYWINKLHYSKVKGWRLMADIFAGSLIFLAVSGLLIVGRKQGIPGRGMWYLIAGILIPVVYIILS